MLSFDSPLLPSYLHAHDSTIDVPTPRRPQPWPGWAVQHIHQHFGEKGDRELAAELTADARDARTYNAKMVEKKRLALGLRRDNIQRQAIIQRNKEAGSYQRPVGYEAKHTVQEGDVRMWKERQPDGTVRQTLRVKQQGLMVSLSVHTWEQAYGPVPDGYIVSFIDGDPLNCAVGNLRLLTRADNIARNRNLEKNQVRQRESLLSRAGRQRLEYQDLDKQLRATRNRKELIKGGQVDERYTVDMIGQLLRDLTKRENELLRKIYLLPESAKEA